MKLSILFRHLKETQTTQVGFLLAIIEFQIKKIFAEDISPVRVTSLEQLSVAEFSGE